jgi:hypothetical protein
VGVIHHDVHARHIRVGNSGSNLPMIIDFEVAEYVGDSAEAEQLIETEMEMVEQMLARNMDRFMDP